MPHKRVADVRQLCQLLLSEFLLPSFGADTFAKRRIVDFVHPRYHLPYDIKDNGLLVRF